MSLSWRHPRKNRSRLLDSRPVGPTAPRRGADRQNGVHYTGIPTEDEFELLVLDGQNLHMHDVDLFYRGIRANTVARTEASRIIVEINNCNSSMLN